MNDIKLTSITGTPEDNLQLLARKIADRSMNWRKHYTSFARSKEIATLLKANLPLQQNPYTDTQKADKKIILDGEGQITFTISDEGLSVEIFQQNCMTETVSLKELARLRNWLIHDLIEKPDTQQGQFPNTMLSGKPIAYTIGYRKQRISSEDKEVERKNE